MASLCIRKIVEQIVRGCLCIVAVHDPLIEAIEEIPMLVGVSDKSGTLAGKSPVSRIDHRGPQYRRVSDNEALAVIRNGLLWRGTGQEGSLRIVQILQCAAPEKIVLPIATQVIVEPGDEGVVVQTDGGAEPEAGV